MITGSLVNLDAVVKYIKKRKPKVVSLVSMGKGGNKPAQKDELCARWIEKKLKSRDIEAYSSRIEELKDGDGKRFFKEENQSWSPKEDFFLCTDLNRFNFVIRAFSSGDNRIVLRKLEKPASSR